MRRRRVAEAWNEFSRLVFGERPISQIQRAETRRAFYAGADSVLIEVMKALGPDTGEPSAEDLKVMDDLQQEFLEFAKAMKEGRA